ncbi:MAG: cupin domain-containing protein [Anaerolineaceae bacterium]|nr:cupin domain-containing protein [Anaerolineaceae bacterium]
MQIHRFDAPIGRLIDRFESSGATVTLVAKPTTLQAVIMHIAPRGVVGYHQAIHNQLFLVVSGEGWVRGETPERTPIQAGEAAFWSAGEWHESGSETGMITVVLEGPELAPALPYQDKKGSQDD